MGEIVRGRREIRDFVYYEELDAHAYDDGNIRLDSSAYAPLFDICSARGLQVVADIHVHPGRSSDAPEQSPTDQANPMLSQLHHIAIIIADFARDGAKLGIYEYCGGGAWVDRSDQGFLYVGSFGP